jgi:hypothetical protein
MARPGSQAEEAIELMRELLAVLPRCDECREPATRANGRGRERYCDRHGGELPDYPRAKALRRAQAFLLRVGPRRT